MDYTDAKLKTAFVFNLAPAINLMITDITRRLMIIIKLSQIMLILISMSVSFTIMANEVKPLGCHAFSKIRTPIKNYYFGFQLD